MNTLEAGWRQNALLSTREMAQVDRSTVMVVQGRDTLIAAPNGRAILHPGPGLKPKDVPRLYA